MSYTPAEITYAATLLTTRIQGLTLAAAKVWVTAEQGANNNVLGTTYTDASGKQQLFSYPTVAMGIQAAANNFNTPLYATAKRAVASTKSAAAQLAAIAASPWNHPYYTSANSGFPAAIAALGGLVTGSAMVGGTAGHPTAGNPLGLGTYAPTVPTPTTMLGAWGSVVSYPVGHVLTATDVTTIMAALQAGGFFATTDPLTGAMGATKTQEILAANIGQVWGTPLEQSLQTQFGQAAAAAGNPFSALGGALGGLIVPIAIVGVIVVLGYKGLTTLLSE